MSTLTEAAPPELQGYSEGASQCSNSQWPAWVLSQREAALSRFLQKGFPTPRDEDWRFTNLARLQDVPFEGAWQRSSNTRGLDSTQDRGVRVDFVDGCWQTAPTSLSGLPPGVRLRSLREALVSDGALETLGFGSRANSENANSPVDLNTALFEDGLVLTVEPGVVVEAPIEIVFTQWGDTGSKRVFPRVFADFGAQCVATVIERWESQDGGAALTNGVCEINAGDGSRVEWIRVQDEDESTVSLGSAHLTLGRDARFDLHSFAFGGALSRMNFRVVFAGSGGEAVLNGLYLPAGSRIADHHMVVEHAEPHCDSHEYFNGILADEGRGVFHGRILVHQKGQKTDAKQTNKNLLLSDDAIVNTKPQLEIYADDVKCTHGATLGQLDATAIFYLRSRGIPETEAKAMLIQAFASEIVERVAYEAEREALRAQVAKRVARMIA